MLDAHIHIRLSAMQTSEEKEKQNRNENVEDAVQKERTGTMTIVVRLYARITHLMQQ